MIAYHLQVLLIYWKSGIVIQQIKMVIIYDSLQVWNFKYISREVSVYVIYKF